MSLPIGTLLLMASVLTSGTSSGTNIMGSTVTVLFDGYSQMTEKGFLANCTCTLIRGKKNIIVDTMTAWDRNKILNALKEQNLSYDEIHFVVSTHGHSDHIGNNNLFLKATHIVGFAVSFENLYYDHSFKGGGEHYVIDEDVTIIPTPGHTSEDVTVLVNTADKGLVTVAGDLFEREEDIANPSLWMDLAGSENPDKQKSYRNHILSIADWIVPGHGPMFAVTQEMKLNVNS